MSKITSIILTLFFLSSPAWGQILDHESSLVVDLNTVTGLWTLECELEVDGIVAFDDHRIDASVQYQIAGTTAITIATSHFDILGSERSKSESTGTQFAFEAKKKGDKLVVGVDLPWPAAGTTEGFICVIGVSRFDNGAPVRVAHMSATREVSSGY